VEGVIGHQRLKAMKVEKGSTRILTIVLPVTKQAAKEVNKVSPQTTVATHLCTQSRFLKIKQW